LDCGFGLKHPISVAARLGNRCGHPRDEAGEDEDGTDDRRRGSDSKDQRREAERRPDGDDNRRHGDTERAQRDGPALDRDRDADRLEPLRLRPLFLDP